MYKSKYTTELKRGSTWLWITGGIVLGALAFAAAPVAIGASALCIGGAAISGSIAGGLVGMKIAKHIQGKEFDRM